MPSKIADKVLSWALDLDEQTKAQVSRVASMPFIHSHVALMPDAHLGMGATIGSVIATKGAIIPSAVGVDIGCGMIAGHLDITAADLPDDLAPLHSLLEKAVPAGIPSKSAKGRGSLADNASSAWDGIGMPEHLDATKTARQFGTLGSGNHFVELCTDDEDDVWIVLHSGSRAAGNLVARHHIEQAKGNMAKWFIDLPDPDLAYVVEGTPEFDEYVSEMLWAQDYAAGSQREMLAAVLNSINTVLDRPVKLVREINCHHNYCEQEHHHGRNMWVTRKGAIRARTGDWSVIPGSMATGSFIVSGLQSNASFHSASHGAGRKMSRTKARRNLSIENLKERMGGIAWNEDAVGLLDEHPDAYKDLDEVMANQTDLVQIEHQLTTILNYKGT